MEMERDVVVAFVAAAAEDASQTCSAVDGDTGLHGRAWVHGATPSLTVSNSISGAS